MCAGGGERQLGELAFTDGYLHQQHRAKPSLLKKFFFLFKDIAVLRRGGRIETGTRLAGIEFVYFYHNYGHKVHLRHRRSGLFVG